MTAKGCRRHNRLHAKKKGRVGA